MANASIHSIVAYRDVCPYKLALLRSIHKIRNFMYRNVNLKIALFLTDKILKKYFDITIRIAVARRG